MKLGYIKGSYSVFGNDGNHFNKAVNDGTNSVVSPALANALYQASDHLPVVLKLLPQSGGIPKAPTGLAADSTSSSQIKLTWTDRSNNEKGFKVERKDGGDWAQIGTATANTETYFSGGLSSDYTYTIRRPEEDIIVYVTSTGTKYHKEGCHYLSESKIAKTLLQAKAEGYTPCSVCNPPTNYK